jgi:hypothetical protein
MSEDKRPEWKNNTPEEVARWFAYNRVIRIQQHWPFSDQNIADSCLICHAVHGATTTVDIDFFQENSEIMFRPDYAGLISVSGKYPDIHADLAKINAWERSNAKDREEYARLTKAPVAWEKMYEAAI